jgi:hypothetical protein
VASIPARPALAAAALLALVLVGVVVERAIVTDEEALQQAWRDFLADFSAEDVDAMGGRFLPSMAYQGPANLVDEGDRAQALVALKEFGDLANSIRVAVLEDEVTVQGTVGVTRSRGRLVFKYGEALTAWTWSVHVAWADDGGWKIQQIDVLELNRGLF